LGKALPEPDPVTGNDAVLIPGSLPVFSNVGDDGRWYPFLLLLDKPF